MVTMQDLVEELENRNITLRSVQRNYDNITQVLEKTRLDLDKAEDDLHVQASEAKAVRAQLEEVTGQRTASEAQVASLSVKLKKAEASASEAEQLRFQKGLQEEKLKVLNERVKSVDEQVKQLRNEKTSAERLATSAERREMLLKETHANLEEKWQTLQADHSSMQSELKCSKDALNQAQQELKGTARDLQTAQRQQVKDQAATKQLHATIHQQARDLEDERRGSKSQKVALESAVGQQRLLESQLRSLQSSKDLEVGQAKEKIEALTKELDEMRDFAQSKQAQLTSLTQTHEQVLGRLKESEQRYEHLLNHSEQEGGMLSEVTHELQSTRKALATLQLDMAALEAERDREKESAAAKIKDLYRNITVGDQLLGKQKSEHFAVVNKLTARLSTLERGVEEFEKRIQKSCDVATANLEDLTKDLGADANTLETEVKHLRGLIESFEERERDLKLRTEGVRLDVLKMSEHAEASKEELNQQMARLQAQLESEKKQALTLGEGRSVAERSAERLRAELAELQRTLTMEGKRASLRIQQAEDALHEMQARTEAERAAASQLLEQEGSLAAARLAQAEKSIQGLTATTKLLEQEREFLKSEHAEAVAEWERKVNDEKRQYDSEMAAAKERLEGTRREHQAQMAEAEAMLNKSKQEYASELDAASERLTVAEREARERLERERKGLAEEKQRAVTALEAEVKAATGLYEQERLDAAERLKRTNAEAAARLEEEKRKMQAENLEAKRQLEEEIAAASGLYERERHEAQERLNKIKMDAEARLAKERRELQQENQETLRALEEEVARANSLYESERMSAEERLNKTQQEAEARLERQRMDAASRLQQHEKELQDQEDQRRRESKRLEGMKLETNNLAGLLKQERQLAADQIAAQKRDISALEASVANREANIRDAHEVCVSLVGDMQVVGTHVDRMVVAQGGKPLAKEPPELLFNRQDNLDNQPVMDGQVLVLAAKEVRSHFAHLTEKVQDVAANAQSFSQRNSIQRSQHEIDKERELQATAAKLLRVEESMESHHSCLMCMSVFKHPVICIPCGHNFCKECVGKTEQNGKFSCSECGEVEGIVDNDILDTLCSKYEYKLSMIKNLNSICSN